MNIGGGDTLAVYSIILKQKELAHKDSLTYPFEERGLQFGDGIYEVVRIYEGRYYLLEEHIKRLFRSAEAIKLSLNYSVDEFIELLLKLIRENNVKTDAKLYLQVTRGSAPRDHAFPDGDLEPNVYGYIEDLPRHLKNLQNGVPVITERDTRWEYCYIKSLNLLPNVLAKQAAKEQGCFEAILHKDGVITEGSSSNVYLVKNDKIYTFPATKRILHGCVRMKVEQFSRELNIPFIEDSFTIEDIPSADEMFLSSSTAEIMPITQVDQIQINDGRPGPITRKLQSAYEKDAQIHTGDMASTT